MLVRGVERSGVLWCAELAAKSKMSRDIACSRSETCSTSPPLSACGSKLPDARVTFVFVVAVLVVVLVRIEWIHVCQDGCGGDDIARRYSGGVWIASVYGSDNRVLMLIWVGAGVIGRGFYVDMQVVGCVDISDVSRSFDALMG